MRRKILVIDDEKDLVYLLKYNLEREGYQVLAAADAEVGLNSVRKNKPDLILLDLMLPGMDGFEFCQTLRRETQTPVVFLTASKSDSCRKLALRLGANDYFTKPFSLDALIRRIRAILS